MINAETAVLDLQGQYRVHTEHLRSDSAEQTLLLVNGSLSTTASFAQAVRYLQPSFNLVLFDLPYAGQSLSHNPGLPLLSREDEAQIILELIERFSCDLLLSFSWGGIATLQALAKRPRRIRRAVLNSFSPQVNAAMLDYLERGVRVLAAEDREQIGQLLNDTIGQYLPSLFKRYNQRHIAALHSHEYAQMRQHIETVLDSPGRSCASFAGEIDIPLLFVNGEWDQYTTTSDARLFTRHAPQSRFCSIARAGHFLEMEHKAAWLQTRDCLLDFLSPGQRCSQPAREEAALAMA